MLIPERVLLRSGGHAWQRAWLSPQHDRTSPALHPVTIMVVDDDERGRWVTARMLRDEGYQVIEARSGEQAFERLLDAGEVSVVLADIAMPGGMDGVQLAEKVLASTPWRRVILMSGYDKLFPQLGSAGSQYPLLMKPFSADQLTRQVLAVLKGQIH